MKKWIKWVVLFFVTAFGSMYGNQAEAAVNTDGSVTINELNFPDERFREGIRCCDIDGDGVLSKEERNVITQISVNLDTSKESWSHVSGNGIYSDVYANCLGIRSYNAPFSIEGICYFEQVTDIFIKGYDYVTGSAKENTNLANVGLQRVGSGGVYADTAAIQAMFPLKQIKRLFLCGIGFQKFSLPGAIELRSLEIIGRYGSNQMRQMDLSSQKKLCTLALHDVRLDKLDLRKNKELVEVRVSPGEANWDYDTHFFYYQAEKQCGVPYYDGLLNNCRLLLPSQNKIKRIQYFVKGDVLDITQCKKLKSLHIGEGAKVKMLRKWYKEVGRRNLCVTVSGDVGKKYKVPRAGKYMKIKGKKNWKNKERWYRDVAS